MGKEPKLERDKWSPPTRGDGGDEASGARGGKVDMPTFSDTNWHRDNEKRIGSDED